MNGTTQEHDIFQLKSLMCNPIDTNQQAFHKAISQEETKKNPEVY